MDETTPIGGDLAAPGADPLEELVAACVEALAGGDAERAEALLGARPELAAAARAQLDDLVRTGLLDDRPEAIGPYRVLETLGRGGMGTVYLAEQRTPVQRRVAVKLVRRGMDTRDVLARFAAERQALALMSHPNIARVFDAGSTVDGRPYFVMEHVAGLPITDYCDRRNMDTRDRLALLLDVCDGVQHAHHKGVVHRDIKPSNVLVAELDGRPIPKIIDFGIAKAIDQRLADVTLHTVHGELLGTPEYMSPEQAGRDALDVDLRTDVYSLGVLLYELLTGELPFPSRRLRTDIGSLQRILREEEPPPPSRRLPRRNPETERRASLRSTTSQDLARSLRGDLDWICMRALEKDRERRYPTVNDLASDIRRHLADEPVLAGPPSRRYRIAKFVRRHRIEVVAAAAVLVALVVGLVASIAFYLRADDAAERARVALGLEVEARQRADAAAVAEADARRQAERDFDNALEAVDTMLTRVADQSLFGAPRMYGVRHRLLTEAEAFYQRFLADHGADPRARYQAARARVVLSRVALALERDEDARATARAAIAELATLRDAAPDDARFAIALAEARDALGQAEATFGRPEQALAAFRAAVDERRALLAQAPADHDRSVALAGALNNLGFLLGDADPSAARSAYQEALQVVDGLVASAGGGVDVDRLVAAVSNGLAGVALRHRDLAAAERHLERASAALAHLDLDGSVDLDMLQAAADVQRKRAHLAWSTGRIDDAIAAGQQEIDAVERLVRDHPDVPVYRSTLATALGNLAVFRSANGVGEDSLQPLRRAVATLAELNREHTGTTVYTRTLATYAGNLAQMLILDGRRTSLAEARVETERVLALLGRLDPDGADPRLIDRRVIALVGLADIARGEGRLADARRAANDAWELARRLWSSQPEAPAFGTTIVTAATVLAAVLDEAAARGAEPPGAARGLLDLVRPLAEQAVAATPDDPQVRGARGELAALDSRVAARSGEVAAARAAAADLTTWYGADGWTAFVARGDALSIASRCAADAELGSAAEAAYVDALKRLDDDLRATPEQPLVRRVRDRVCVEIACAQAARGETGPAAASLDAALPRVRAARPVLRVDVDADDALARGLAERARLALDAGDVATARANAEALALEFPDAGRMLTAARYLARAGAAERALDLLEACLRDPPAGLAAALDDAVFDAVRGAPRFAALRAAAR
ncbi:MAG: protein kinase [Planctomycetes bacterium]|nr:protein kinase [Planctomycetota bacterium]